MSVIPATAVGWTPTVEHPERDFYYMANIRYPVLADPLGMDRVAMLLWKAREALSRITFQWVQLKSPKRGECFLVVRPEDSSYRPPDGYKWQPKPELSTKAVGDKTVELSRFKMIESHEASLVRLEYRLVLPNNRLIYVHYLEDNTTTTLHNLTTIRQPPAVSIPDPRMLMTTVMRPPAMRQTSGQVASVPTRPGLVPRGVPPVRRIPAPVAQAQPTRQSIDDLPDLINGIQLMWHLLTKLRS